MKLEAAIREYLIEIEIRKYAPKNKKGVSDESQSLFLYLRFLFLKLSCFL